MRGGWSETTGLIRLDRVVWGVPALPRRHTRPVHALWTDAQNHHRRKRCQLVLSAALVWGPLEEVVGSPSLAQRDALEDSKVLVGCICAVAEVLQMRTTLADRGWFGLPAGSYAVPSELQIAGRLIYLARDRDTFTCGTATWCPNCRLLLSRVDDRPGHLVPRQCGRPVLETHSSDCRAPSCHRQQQPHWLRYQCSYRRCSSSKTAMGTRVGSALAPDVVR